MNRAENPTTPCLSDLEIADLLVGALEGEARENAMRHLLECPDCYAVYLDAQACLDEAEDVVEDDSDQVVDPAPVHASGEGDQDGDEEANVISFPRKAPTWSGWAVAAGLVLGVGLASMIPDGRGTPTDEWARLGDGPKFTSPSSPTPTFRDRGPYIGAQTAGDFRFGVAWAHLGIVPRSGDEDSAASAVKEVSKLVAERTAGRALDAVLGEATTAYLNAPRSEEHDRLTGLLAYEMFKLGYEFDLGRFAETGRLAAEAHFADWFDPDGEAARYLEEMRAARSSLAAEASDGLDAIAEAWPGSDAVDEDYKKAAEAFAGLILAYDAAAD